MNYEVIAMVGWATAIALSATLFYMSINRRISDVQRQMRDEMDGIRRWIDSDSEDLRRRMHDLARQMNDPLDIHNKGKKFYNTEA